MAMGVKTSATSSKGRDRVSSLKMPSAFRLLTKSKKSQAQGSEIDSSDLSKPGSEKKTGQETGLAGAQTENVVPNNVSSSAASSVDLRQQHQQQQQAGFNDLPSSSTVSLDSKTIKGSVSTPVSTPSSSEHVRVAAPVNDLLRPPALSRTGSSNSNAESDQGETVSAYGMVSRADSAISTTQHLDASDTLLNNTNGNTNTGSINASLPILSLQESQRSAVAVRSSMDLSATSPITGGDRDRYGFKKKTNFISEADYDKWWSDYQKHLRKRKRKWVQLMKENGLSVANDQPQRFPAKSDKLKRYIRKGIPAEWRGNAWWWYAKGPEKLSAHPGMYDSLCKQTLDLVSTDTDLIERDLNRTFPDNIYFREDPPNDVETPLISALRRVLRSFSVYVPSVGYCQSLNFIAGTFLLFMEEEKAFWMLVIITQRYLPGMHEVTLEGVNIEQGVLILCIKETLPEMWNKIRGNFDGEPYDNVLVKLPPITLCTASWFMSAYVSVLPVETMLRVWDCFFFENSKIFFRIALTLLKMAEPSVKHLQDQMDIIQVVQNYPKKMLDSTLLMENCFKRRNGFERVTQEEIVNLRVFVEERRKAAAANADKTNGKTRNGNMNMTASEQAPNGPDGLTDLEAYKKLKRLHIGNGGNQSLQQRINSIRERGQIRERALVRKVSGLGLN